MFEVLYHHAKLVRPGFHSAPGAAKNVEFFVTGSIARKIRGRFWHVAPTGGCNDDVIRPPKLKILLKFDQSSEYERPTGAYPLRDFREICRLSIGLRRSNFQDALAVKIWMNFLKALRSYRGF